MAIPQEDRRLGLKLMEGKIVTPPQFNQLLTEQRETNDRLSDMLLRKQLCTEDQLREAFAQLEIDLIELDGFTPDPEAVSRIPSDTAHAYRVLPVRIEDGDDPVLVVATLDPLSGDLFERIEDLAGMSIRFCLPRRAAMEIAMRAAYEGVESAPIQPGSFAQFLIDQGLIDEHRLQPALLLQRSSGRQLGSCLLELGTFSEEELYAALATHQQVPLIDDSLDAPPRRFMGRLQHGDSMIFDAVIVGEVEQDDKPVPLVAMSDLSRRSEVEESLGAVSFALAMPSHLATLRERFYPAGIADAEERLARGELAQTAYMMALRKWVMDRDQSFEDYIQELGGREDNRLEESITEPQRQDPVSRAKALAREAGAEFLDGSRVTPDPDAVALLDEKFCRRYSLIPIEVRANNELLVAMRDPRNVFVLEDVRSRTGMRTRPAVMVERDITRLIERSYGAAGMADLGARLSAEAGRPEDTAEALDSLDDNAVVKAVDSIIREAALQEASDIHVEPTGRELKIRYRVDGSLREQPSLPMASSQGILARIKIIGGLDISERRVPQDGRIRFRKGSIDLDLRLSTLPVAHGEKAVMRLLQKAENIPEVEQLGFSDHNRQRYYDVIQKPNGIFLVTGPTGSGKSFTSFSTLKRIARPEKNTTTIEDPIEYEIPGIVQSQVNNAAGMTFARALRAFLRQDPDIIFVGEIRDQETAKIAVEAALTGHLVLATLHTNDAPGAITRLEEMGVENFNIAAAVVGVLAQRLVRRVCGECAQPTTADPDVLRRLNLTPADLEGATLKAGAGCPRCGGTGYKGRMGIHELMVIDDPLRRAIGSGMPVAQVKDVAVGESDMTTLRTDGIEKAKRGLTTLEEVLAVTSV